MEKKYDDGSNANAFMQMKEEVRNLGKTFVMRGLCYAVLLFVVAMGIAFLSNRGWIMAPAIVSALYAMVLIVTEGVVWVKVASRSLDGLTTFYTAVSGFRMLITLGVMLGYYVACGREQMLGFLLVLAPFYVMMLVHHSIFFGFKSKIVDKFNNVKQNS